MEINSGFILQYSPALSYTTNTWTYPISFTTYVNVMAILGNNSANGYCVISDRGLTSCNIVKNGNLFWTAIALGF